MSPAAQRLSMALRVLEVLRHDIAQPERKHGRKCRSPELAGKVLGRLEVFDRLGVVVVVEPNEPLYEEPCWGSERPEGDVEHRFRVGDVAGWQEADDDVCGVVEG